MKLILATLAVAMALAFGPHARAWETVESMNRQIDETNFIVGNGCSGTLISIEKRLVVTAYHCIDSYIKQVEREVVSPDGTVTKVKKLKLDPVTISQRDYRGARRVGALEYVTDILAYRQERDMALLQIKSENLRSTMASPILSAGEKVLRGEPIYAVGNPRMLDASVTSGVVSSVTRSFRVPWALNEDVNFIQFDANIQPGSSGGALYDSRGKFIGITVAAFQGSDLSLAIPVYDLHDLLNDFCMASVYDPEANDAACEAEKVDNDNVDK